jgi:hypothetical protein
LEFEYLENATAAPVVTPEVAVEDEDDMDFGML